MFAMRQLKTRVLPYFMASMAVLALGCGADGPSSGKAPILASANVEKPPALENSIAGNQPANGDDPVSPSEAAPPVGETSLELRELNWDQLQARVASHAGKVVVVDIWSTSCEPCLREFPRLVELQKRHPNEVVCFSFNCDFVGARNKPLAYYRERVLKALTQTNAGNIINGMSSVAADDLFRQLDLDSIPAVYVFDQTGKLAKRFDNRTPASPTEEGISYELQIDPLVAELIKSAKLQAVESKD